MEISFSEKGKGFPVVLLPGFCETRSLWSEFVDELSQKYRVLTPDLPGFGGSPLPDTTFNIDDIGNIIFQWLQQQDIEETVVIGHSLGGYITLALAKQHPEILKGIGLFHSTAFADTEEKRSSRNKTIDFVKKQGVETFATSFVPQLFNYKNRKNLKEEIASLVNTTSKTSEESLIAYTKAMRDRDDRTDVLKKFSQPILLIAGEEDKAVPVEDIRRQELLPEKSVVYVLENTGHMGMIEARQQTLRAVGDFLDICQLN